MAKQSIVFTPARIGHLEIKNRLVRSAIYENAATSAGEVSDALVRIYRTWPKEDRDSSLQALPVCTPARCRRA